MALLKTKEISDQIELNEFDYSFLSPELTSIYRAYKSKFQTLFEQYSDAWGLENCYFYIKSSDVCNASATKFNEFNLINITNGYPILMNKKLQSDFFKNVLFIALINDKSINDAYVDVFEKFGNNLIEFINNCSVNFTFHHEFRHILQFNFSPSNRNFDFSENFSSDSKFKMAKHAWEYDADRSTVYRVLRFAYQTFVDLGLSTPEQLKCVFYLALSSIILTKNLFYFNVINDHTNREKIRPNGFYTKMYSHPHALVRIVNVLSYFIDCANDDHENLKMDLQETINNVLKINKLYFESLHEESNFTNQFVEQWGAHSNKINSYNNELYEFSIRNKSIKSLLEFNGTRFGA
ncbi:hypothetical protein [Aliivibrio fischeri]|uniref:hypothetical protein n=1 Tax=Aliivibrio fischeri TaxID=668 RepID=UPI00084BD820|nr:hypothetical protein [Aliivibrio fischeri]OED53757.1 hypothetical protein BEI47_17410 [Aliivibrio fischeri]